MHQDRADRALSERLPVYERILGQKPQNSDKIYYLYEPQVYCIAKGNKVSFAVTSKSNIIVGVVTHEHNVFNAHTLPDILKHKAASRGKEIKTAACDRGYRGSKTVGNTQIILPGSPLKRGNRYQRDQKRKRRLRAAIEPVIGHLKTDFRLGRNFLKGTAWDLINALLDVSNGMNLKLWLRAFWAFIFPCIDRFNMLPKLRNPILIYGSRWISVPNI